MLQPSTAIGPCEVVRNLLRIPAASSSSSPLTQMLPHTATPAAPLPWKTGRLTELLQLSPTLFANTAPLTQARVAAWWWVAALTVAGAAARFYGLGGVGLHGDEETMAMAVRQIRTDGFPILPSGLFYPRGLTQLYLMALSTSLFGETEWALRLPSVLAGVAMIPLAYVVGRRFLRPEWSVGLTSTVAFLPELLVYSQTARMYIFLVAFIMASLACLFAWERTGRTGWLVGAVGWLILGLDMHVLAVGALLMLLFPGLISGDARRLVWGAGAGLVVFSGFVLIDQWLESQYPTPPPEFVPEIGASIQEHTRLRRDFPFAIDAVLWGAGLIVIGLVARSAARTINPGNPTRWTGALLVAGLLLQLAFYHHLAALCYIAGVVLALRYAGARARRPLLLFAFGCALLGVAQVLLLTDGAERLTRLVGGLVGQPSVWPYVRIGQMSALAALLAAGAVGYGCWQLACARRAPDYALLAVLGAWAPVFALGAFAWNVPSRYTSMSLVPMLLCGFAFAQTLYDRWTARRGETRDSLRSQPIHLAVIAIVTIACINPVAAVGAVTGGYSTHPDHKGAAEFMRRLPMRDEDIVLAEDVLQQTYYLGKVDYWLIGPGVARRYVVRAEEGVVDFYTGTPVIATGAMLDELLQEHPHKRIYVIGSGEDQRDGRRVARGPELHAALNSPRFETIYVGRDRLTRVLRAVPGVVKRSESVSAESAADSAELSEAAPPSHPKTGAARSVPKPAAPSEPQPTAE